jgi:hypothetical protein
LIGDNVVPFFYLLFFVAQVLIHLDTWTSVVSANIGIAPLDEEQGRPAEPRTAGRFKKTPFE